MRRQHLRRKRRPFPERRLSPGRKLSLRLNREKKQRLLRKKRWSPGRKLNPGKNPNRVRRPNLLPKLPGKDHPNNLSRSKRIEERENDQVPVRFIGCDDSRRRSQV